MNFCDFLKHLPIVLFCADILAGSGSGVVVSLKDAS